DEETPVDDAEHDRPDAQPEEAAARQRRELDDQQEAEQDRERQLQPMPALESQVDRREEEQRYDEHHAEVVRVARQPVDAIAVRLPDGAPDVDRRGSAGDRVEDDGIEVVSSGLREELDQPDRGVRRERSREPA